MGGSLDPSDHSISWGQLGVPDPNNDPGRRYGSTIWQLSDYSIILFGGYAHRIVPDDDETPLIYSRTLADLWTFNGSMWTWIGGSTSFFFGGNYTGPNLMPGPRFGANGWMGNDGSLWLFGGDGEACCIPCVMTYFSNRIFNDVVE